MKKNKAVFRIVTVIILVLLSVSLMTGCEGGLFSGMKVSNPKKTIIEFVNAMQADEFDQAAADAAMDCIGNYATMGFEKFSQVRDDELESELFDILRKSYKIEFFDDSLDDVDNPYQSEDMNISAKNASIKFKFTSVKYSMISDTLSNAVTEEAEDRIFHGETYETEEAALVLAREIFGKIFDQNTNMDDYCVERELVLEMKYIDSKWKIMISEEFYDALLGK